MPDAGEGPPDGEHVVVGSRRLDERRDLVSRHRKPARGGLERLVVRIRGQSRALEQLLTGASAEAGYRLVALPRSREDGSDRVDVLAPRRR